MRLDDERAVSGGVDCLIAGREYDVRAEFAAKRNVPLECAGVIHEIFAWSELCFVDENSDDHLARGSGKLAGAPNQAEVPLVQAAHRWHQHDHAA